MQLEITDLNKTYNNGTKALNNVSMNINAGILGLLGPNGAGKSTLMRILATLIQPNSGKVLFNGINLLQQPKKIRAQIGYLPQEFGVYDQLSAPEFLKYLAAVKGIPSRLAKKRIQELLQLLNLTEAGQRKLSAYSGGMKQRVGIAQALLNDPTFLIVDEPTVGLDPEERVRFRKLLADLAGDRIIILSTHIVSDVESIATEIAIINKGENLIQTSPEQLLTGVEGQVWRCTVNKEMAEKLEQDMIISNTIRRSQGFELRIVNAIPPTKDAISAIPTLEDAYLYYTRNHNIKMTDGEVA